MTTTRRKFSTYRKSYLPCKTGGMADGADRVDGGPQKEDSEGAGVGVHAS